MRVNIWTVLVAFGQRWPSLVARGSLYFEAPIVHFQINILIITRTLGLFAMIILISNVFFIMSIILIRQSHICHRHLQS